MGSKEILKKVVFDEYDVDANYSKILEKISKKNVTRRYKFILITASTALVLGLVYTSLGKNTNNRVDESYFLSSVYADDTKYNLDDEIKISWNNEPIESDKLCYEFPYYLDTDETFTDIFGEVCKLNKVYSRGLKLNLKIEGDNIEKIIYTINDSKGNAQIYRGISGELSDINPFSEDEVFYTPKGLHGYTLEDKQRLLDIDGYTEKKAEDFTQEEFEKYLHYRRTEDIQNTEVHSPQEPIISDKEMEFVMWDIINRGTTIEVPENEQDDKYAIFITKVLEDINQYKTSPDFYALESNPDTYFGTVLSPQGLAKAVAKETSITIQIVYKNGIVHKKILTFNLVEIIDPYKDLETGVIYENKFSTLQGVIK